MSGYITTQEDLKQDSFCFATGLLLLLHGRRLIGYLSRFEWQACHSIIAQKISCSSSLTTETRSISPLFFLSLRSNHAVLDFECCFGTSTRFECILGIGSALVQSQSGSSSSAISDHLHSYAKSCGFAKWLHLYLVVER